ncbi:phosphatase PAP2 family protein [Raineyella antarctica]|nr:phosphatase PAP2 family protein [Raineyella antarctica]
MSNRPDDSEDPDKGTEGELREDRQVGGRDLTHWETPVGGWLARTVQRISLVLGPRTVLIIILAIGAAVSATLTWVTSELYENIAQANGIALLDQPVLRAMMNLRSPWLDSLATDYTNIGGAVGMPIVAAVIMVILAVHRRSWTPVILITAAGAGSLLMTIAGKQLLGRARPPLVDAVPPYEYSPAFPSGHSLNSLVIAGIVAYLLLLRQHSRRTRILTVVVAALFAFTIGVSRVFLGHHWLTDVLGAWLLGTAWLVAVITAHRLYLTATKRTAAVAPEEIEGG